MRINRFIYKYIVHVTTLIAMRHTQKKNGKLQKTKNNVNK